jgi:hypothetical protein
MFLFSALLPIHGEQMDLEQMGDIRITKYMLAVEFSDIEILCASNSLCFYRRWAYCIVIS